MPEKKAFSAELLDTHCIVDVRTPLEYAEDHIPGAINVPLLTNEERVEVGTLHRQAGPAQARIRALELTCGRFAHMVKAVADQAYGRPILVYCWRGGLRSRSLAVLLEAMGYRAVQLIGGYKAFRHQVISYFETFVPPAPLLVIHGMTGVGKTTFIQSLDPEKWTMIDLEGLASHRGSAFGGIGLADAPDQKRFDTLLWDAFRRAPADRPIVVEGESQRIGRLSLPGALYAVMADSSKIWCTASMETRIERLAQEYAHRENREAMEAALERIKKKLGGQRYADLQDMLAAWDVPGFCRGLIEGYYDKLYYKHRHWQPDAEIDLEDLDEARRQLATYYYGHCPKRG